ncbi:MAG: F0F1 ATP synthase subunit delta [Candidatus Paceibacterota bacterium]
MATISIKNLAEAIYDSSLNKEGKEFNDVVDKCALYLKNRNLLGKKEEILKALEKIVNKEGGIVKAKVTTESKLKKEYEKEIEEFIKKKYKVREVILELKEDTKLLGGIKIEIGDEIIDGTLSGKIKQLQDYLITN